MDCRPSSTVGFGTEYNALLGKCNALSTRKDVHNLKSMIKISNPNEVEDCLNVLNKISYSATVLIPDSDNYRVICWSTTPMRETFGRFPEVLAMDTTFNINNCGMPVLTLMATTNTFASVPVFIACLANQQAATIEIALSLFKACMGEAWKRIQTFMVDKCPAEYKALRSQFPQSRVILCRFHIMKDIREQTRQPKYADKYVYGNQLADHLKYSFRHIMNTGSTENFDYRVSTAVPTR